MLNARMAVPVASATVSIRARPGLEKATSQRSSRKLVARHNSQIMLYGLRQVKLDRDQRAMLHKLPYGDFLEIISEVLEAKAAEAARPIVWEAVRMLEEEAKLAGISVQGHDLNAKALKRLKKRLAHLNVVSLLALANRRCQGSMSTELVQIAAELRFQAE